MPKKQYEKIVLVVLDGFGVATYSHGNAVALANPEAMNGMIARYPALTLLASGPVVGLPWGEMGNSEVGHLNMGAGRIVGQDLPRINKSISDRSFFSNDVLLAATDHVKKSDSSLHLLGMVSDGGVHSSQEHLFALLGFAAEQNVKKVYIHIIADGRDSNQKAIMESVHKLNRKIKAIGIGEVATICGRFYGMDRGGHWDQTDAVYRSLVFAEGEQAETIEDAILNNYNQHIYDEMIPPTVITKEVDGELTATATVADNDAVIFFNFRPDRAVQLTQAFVDIQTLPEQNQHRKLDNLLFVTMTEYFHGLDVQVAFPAMNFENNLAEVLSKQGMKQYHTAEREKFAHVTSFFNSGKSEPFPGEDRVIVPSPTNNANYDERPEMSGANLTETLIDKVLNSDYQFYLANFANADMVGHTGNLDASIRAVIALDGFLEKIKRAVLKVGGLLIITADHGNIEHLLDAKTAEINKEHTTNPIPFIVIAANLEYKKSKSKNYLTLSGMTPAGIVADIAPTILDFYGVDKPAEMDGVSLRSQIERMSKE